jgi:glycosyltransferase involved in cell wall biosynthesis
LNDFSVLISIYYKEKPEYFDRAMKSIWDEQIVKPNEIVLVQDGKLTDELINIVSIWKNKLEDIMKIVPLENNVGLGDALNLGLKECTYELVARMDTDDISLANRFEEQIKIFQQNNVDLCGSWIDEFESDENEIISSRKVPEFNSDIIKFSKMRNPINHPSVMFKKSSVINAGNYKKMFSFEDYYLWIRMLMNNSNLYNIQKSLLKMRAGYNQLERRRGLKYVIYEFNFWLQLYKDGFINLIELLKNLLIKLFIRVMPRNFVKFVYKIIRD